RESGRRRPRRHALVPADVPLVPAVVAAAPAGVPARTVDECDRAARGAAGGGAHQPDMAGPRRTDGGADVRDVLAARLRPARRPALAGARVARVRSAGAGRRGATRPGAALPDR